VSNTLESSYGQRQSGRAHSAYRRRDEFITRIERILAQFGVEDFEYGARNNGHRAVFIRHGGKECSVTFPFSSKNWNAPKLTVTKVRRALIEMGATR
jgi:hypothetical protein